MNNKIHDEGLQINMESIFSEVQNKIVKDFLEIKTYVSKTNDINKLKLKLQEIDGSIMDRLGNMKQLCKTKEEKYSINSIVDNVNELKLYILEKIKGERERDNEEIIKQLVNKFSDKFSNIENGSNIKLQMEEIQNDLKNVNIKIDNQKDINNEYKQKLLFEEQKANLKMKSNEQFANIVNGFIKKESISSLFGGILLFIFGIGLMIAMFVKTEVTQIIQSSFLIILGYFFGHSTLNKHSD